MIVLILGPHITLDKDYVTFRLKEDATIKDLSVTLYQLPSNVTTLVMHCDAIENKEELKEVLGLYKAQSQCKIVLCTQDIKSIGSEFREISSDFILIDSNFEEDIKAAITKDKEESLLVEDKEESIENDEVEDSEEVPGTEEVEHYQEDNSKVPTFDEDIYDKALQEIFDSTNQSVAVDDNAQEVEPEHQLEDKQPTESSYKKLTSIFSRKKKKEFNSLKTIGVMGIGNGVGTTYTSILVGKGLLLLGRNPAIINLTDKEIEIEDKEFPIHNIGRDMSKVFKYYNEYDNLIFLCGNYLDLKNRAEIINMYMTTAKKIVITSYLPYKISSNKDVDQNLLTSIDTIGIVGMPKDDEERGEPDLVGIPFSYKMQDENSIREFIERL